MLETVIGTTRLAHPPLDTFQQSKLWQAVEDLQNGVVNILQFVIVDLIGIIISAGLCYKMAGFNIFKALGYLQKEYGMMLAVSQVLPSQKSESMTALFLRRTSSSTTSV